MTTQPSAPPAAPAAQGSGGAAQPARGPPPTGPPPGLSENSFKKVTGDTPFTPEQLEKVVILEVFHLFITSTSVQ